MAAINCELQIDQDGEQIGISGLQDDDIIIDISNDVDFTEMVSLLSNLINRNEEIELTKTEVEDEKIRLIVGTITDIISSFNHNLDKGDEFIREATSESTDDLPF